MKKHYEDEIELKNDLDSIGIRYGDRIKNSYQFIVYIWDNKGNTIISKALYTSPIQALRIIPGLLEKLKLPIEDLDIEIKAVFDENTCELFQIESTISPYMYFKKEEINISDKEN